MEGKPASVKAIGILVIVKLVLKFIVFTIVKLDLFKLPTTPDLVLYTGLSYIITSILIFLFIKKRNLLGLRIILVIDILINIPGGFALAILFDIISIGLTFRKFAKVYFNQA